MNRLLLLSGFLIIFYFPNNFLSAQGNLSNNILNDFVLSEDVINKVDNQQKLIVGSAVQPNIFDLVTFPIKFSTEQYIKVHQGLAVLGNKTSGIPVSIILAQGILESNSGNSNLVKMTNNHFGIKCHNWGKDSVKFDDDKPQECFRKYKNANESFTDYSNFLRAHNRYSFLFKYNKSQYKKWAKGLKKSGYATDSNYDKKLISIIEKHHLYDFDN